MQKMSYQEIINKEEMQRLQDEFCAATGVALYCLNTEGEQITELSGPEEARNLLEECLVNDAVRTVLDRVEEGSLEDLAIEEIEENGSQIAAIAVRMDDSTVFYWVASWTDTENPERFCCVLDLLRDSSYTVISNKIMYYSAEAESRRSQYARQAMSRDLRTVEAMAAIVQLLDSDDTIETIMDKWLSTLGEHLQVDTAQVFRLNDNQDTMDVICEWRNHGQITFFDRTTGIPLTPYLRTVKPIVLSQGGLQKEHQKELDKIGLKAVMVFPILHKDNTPAMVLSLNHRHEGSNWNTAEIKFTSDAVKIMKSILTKRIQKNSWRGPMQHWKQFWIMWDVQFMWQMRKMVKCFLPTKICKIPLRRNCRIIPS